MKRFVSCFDVNVRPSQERKDHPQIPITQIKDKYVVVVVLRFRIEASTTNEKRS